MEVQQGPYNHPHSYPHTGPAVVVPDHQAEEGEGEMRLVVLVRVRTSFLFRLLASNFLAIPCLQQMAEVVGFHRMLYPAVVGTPH